MKFAYSMLLEYVSTSLSAEEAGELLTMAGFEVEGIEEVEGEPVLDVKVVSNRGDGLSVLGLAREVIAKAKDAEPTALYSRLATGISDLSPTAPTAPDKPGLGSMTNQMGRGEDSGTHPQSLVAIETPDCTRYACRVFRGVPSQASPDWLQKRIRQAGWRPIGLVVDLTNYVMLELGQPLHAFDMDKLRGGWGERSGTSSAIVVRKARPGEKLTTLDGGEHELNPNQMMICDAERPVAAAGIMGGAETEFSDKTTNLLLESAHFESASVRRTRKEMGLSTEASYRFERSVDPEGVVRALDRFAELLALFDGGKSLVSGLADVYPAPPEPRTMTLRMSRCDRLLGVAVNPIEARLSLEDLGFLVDGDGEPFAVTAPSWRPDVVREDDLIEEVGRVHGYDKIPEVLPQGSTAQGGVFGSTAFVDQMREGMLRAGYTQCISHTLRDRHPLDFTEGWRVTVKNPHSPEMAYLRDSVLPNLADAARRNGARDVHLFEIGRVFVRGDRQIDESRELGILSVGALEPPHWAKPGPPEADFYSLKGAVEAACRHAGVPVVFDLPRDPDRRFHPTRQAGVLVDEGKLWVGTVGQIHPDVAAASDLPESTVLAELDLEVLATEAGLHDVRLGQISRNPSVRRDIAVLVSKSVSYASLEGAIRDACGEVLERVWAFDVFEGKILPEGTHSVAIAMQLRKLGENFTDDEAYQVRVRAVAALGSLGATQR